MHTDELRSGHLLKSNTPADETNAILRLRSIFRRLASGLGWTHLVSLQPPELDFKRVRIHVSDARYHLASFAHQHECARTESGPPRREEKASRGHPRTDVESHAQPPLAERAARAMVAVKSPHMHSRRSKECVLPQWLRAGRGRHDTWTATPARYEKGSKGLPGAFAQECQLDQSSMFSTDACCALGLRQGAPRNRLRSKKRANAR